MGEPFAAICLTRSTSPYTSHSTSTFHATHRLQSEAKRTRDQTTYTDNVPLLLATFPPRRSSTAQQSANAAPNALIPAAVP